MIKRRGLGRGWKVVEDVLELERVLAPDVLVGVHRVDRNHELVPCVDAIYDQTQASWTMARTHPIEDPSFMGKTVSLKVDLTAEKTGEYNRRDSRTTMSK